MYATCLMLLFIPYAAAADMARTMCMVITMQQTFDHM